MMNLNSWKMRNRECDTKTLISTHQCVKVLHLVMLRNWGDWVSLDGAALDCMGSGSPCRAMVVVHIHGSRGTADRAEVVDGDSMLVLG